MFSSRRFDVKGANVLITGTSTGIGRHLAECFARDGANLFMSALPRERKTLENGARVLANRYGVSAWTHAVDLSTRTGPEKLFAAAEEAAGGRIDVLVNNAGTLSYGPFHEAPLPDLDRVAQVNFVAYMKLMRLALPGMVARRRGRVLNVGSASAFQPVPLLAVYATTKAAIVNLSSSVGEEVREAGIRICTLNPSYTATPLLGEKTGFPTRLKWFKVSGLADAGTVARKGYQAFLKGREIYVPGLKNKLTHEVLSPFMPRRLALAFALRSSRPE